MEQLKSYFIRAIDVVLFGNFFIAACAAGLIFTSYKWMGVPVKIDTLSLFVFSSTLFQYTLHRFLTMRARKDVHNYITDWSRRNQFLIFMLALASGGAAANLAFHLNRGILISLIPLGALSLLYEVPFKYKNFTFRLRNIWYFKTILIVSVWTFSTVLFPYFQYEKNIFSTSFILLFTYRAVLIFILALAFDIRDFDYDKAEHVNTIPVSMGLFRMRRLFLILTIILTALGLLRIAMYPDVRWASVIASVIAPIVVYRIVSLSYKKPQDYFYSVLVDGAMLVELIITMVLNRFF